MWRFTVSRAPSRWAAVRHVAAGAFSATDVTAALVSCRVARWRRPVHTFNHTEQKPSPRVISKKVEFPVNLFQLCTQPRGINAWCVNSCSHTAFLRSVWCGRAAADTAAFYFVRFRKPHIQSPRSSSKIGSCHLLLKFVFLCFYYFQSWLTPEVWCASCQVDGILLLNAMERRGANEYIKCLPRPQWVTAGVSQITSFSSKIFHSRGVTEN